MAIIALYYMNYGYNVEIPFEKSNQYNPDLLINDLKCEIKTIHESDWMRDVDPDTGFGKEKFHGSDVCYDIGTFIGKENSGYKGILQGDVIFADLTLKSLGNLLSTIKFFLKENKMEYTLPEPKKHRIIYFSRRFKECKGYYLDFDPKLWNLIEIASKIMYQKAMFSFRAPANGKFHKVELPEPPEKIKKK